MFIKDIIKLLNKYPKKYTAFVDGFSLEAIKINKEDKLVEFHVVKRGKI